MIEKYVTKTKFDSYEDFVKNFRIKEPKNFNFGYDVVDKWAALAPNKEAVCCDKGNGWVESVNYEDLKNLSDKTASFFLSIGVKKGDRVILMLKKNIEWWFCMIALHKIGAVAVPSSHMLKTADIVYRVQESEATTIVTLAQEDFFEEIEEVKKQCPMLNNLISVGDKTREGWFDYWEEIMQAEAFERPSYEIASTDKMLIYFTSGTSSHPKMVVHDFRYPLGHIVTALWQGLDSESRQLTLTDTGWAMAIWGMIYPQLFVGATIVVYDFQGHFNPRGLLDVLDRQRVTAFFAHPTVYRMLLQEKWEGFDLSSLTQCTVAGESSQPNIFDQWAARTNGVRVRESFAQTEGSLMIGMFPWCEYRKGSMGKISPTFRIDVVDDNGQPCGVGEIGHLVVYLDNGNPIGLFTEYYKDEEMTKKSHGGEYYDTNDLAYKDADDYYWYVSRSDDVIKSSGYRISPLEVEAVVQEHEAVQDCLVSAFRDEIRGNVIKCSVVLKEAFREAEKGLLSDSIKQFCRERTAAYKYPRIIEFVAEIPRNINGKKIRQKM